MARRFFEPSKGEHGRMVERKTNKHVTCRPLRSETLLIPASPNTLASNANGWGFFFGCRCPPSPPSVLCQPPLPPSPPNVSRRGFLLVFSCPPNASLRRAPACRCPHSAASASPPAPRACALCVNAHPFILVYVDAKQLVGTRALYNLG